MLKRFYILILCVFLFGASYSTGSRSYSSSSSSSRSYSSPTRSYSSPSSSSKSYSSPTRTYSSPSSSKSYSSSSSSKSSSSVPTKSFDSKASAAKEVSNSRSWFNFSKSKAPSYPAPKDISPPQVQRNKQETFYRNYYYDTSPRTVVIRNHHYSDNLSPFFWMWLMDRNADERAAYAYNHRNDMDKERYNDLLKKDADLEKKVKELEAKGVKADPNYKPAGIDSDLMYQEQPEQKDEGINPYWYLLILFPLAGALFWIWRKW